MSSVELTKESRKIDNHHYAHLLHLTKDLDEGENSKISCTTGFNTRQHGFELTYTIDGPTNYRQIMAFRVDTTNDTVHLDTSEGVWFSESKQFRTPYKSMKNTWLCPQLAPDDENYRVWRLQQYTQQQDDDPVNVFMPSGRSNKTRVYHQGMATKNINLLNERFSDFFKKTLNETKLPFVPDLIEYFAETVEDLSAKDVNDMPDQNPKIKTRGGQVNRFTEDEMNFMKYAFAGDYRKVGDIYRSHHHLFGPGLKNNF